MDVARFVTPPADGETVRLGQLGVVFKVAGERTGGAFSVVEHPIPPGVLVPPHAHEREDELTYVIEGEIGARIGVPDDLSVPAGAYLWKPRGVPHTFWNAGPAHARILEIIAPAGFEDFFREMASLFPAEGLPDFEEVDRIGRRYGQTYHDEGWVEELCARYGLRVLGR